jgi:GMP synthase-like glutamine amidotransferase
MRNVLVLQHVPYEGQGYIADYMQDHAIDFDVVRLWESYASPDVSKYSALIIMGGPMGVYEEYPARNDEVALIKTAIGTVPTLGICLGSQLIAHALGARVYPNAQDGKPAKEIGYSTVHLTPEGSANRLFKGFPTGVRVLQWHGDTFDLPAGASLLATSPLCRHQAFAFQSAYGLLFHLELTPEMVRGLAEANRAWTHESFNLDEERLNREARELAPLMRAQCYRLLDNFFTQYPSAPPGQRS